MLQRDQGVNLMTKHKINTKNSTGQFLKTQITTRKVIFITLFLISDSWPPHMLLGMNLIESCKVRVLVKLPYNNPCKCFELSFRVFSVHVINWSCCMMVYAKHLTLVIFQTGGVTNCKAGSLQQHSLVIVGVAFKRQITETITQLPVTLNGEWVGLEKEQVNSWM